MITSQSPIDGLIYRIIFPLNSATFIIIIFPSNMLSHNIIWNIIDILI